MAFTPVNLLSAEWPMTGEVKSLSRVIAKYA